MPDRMEELAAGERPKALEVGRSYLVVEDSNLRYSVTDTEAGGRERSKWTSPIYQFFTGDRISIGGEGLATVQRRGQGESETLTIPASILDYFLPSHVIEDPRTGRRLADGTQRKMELHDPEIAEVDLRADDTGQKIRNLML